MSMEILKTYEELPSTTQIDELANFFRILGDTTRIKIIFHLYHSEMCVRELTNKLNITESAVSHQLKILRDYKIIKKCRKGKMFIYSVSDKYGYEIIEQGFKFELSIRRRT